jgi:hypothetical protein
VKLKYVALNVAPERVQFLAMVPACTVLVLAVSLVINVELKYVVSNVALEHVHYLTMVPVCTVIVLAISLETIVKQSSVACHVDLVPANVTAMALVNIVTAAIPAIPVAFVRHAVSIAVLEHVRQITTGLVFIVIVMVPVSREIIVTPVLLIAVLENVNHSKEVPIATVMVQALPVTIVRYVP